MASDSTPQPAPQPAPGPSLVQIVFPDLDRADGTVTLERVSAGQVFAAAYLLDLVAHELRAGVIKPAGGLALPGPEGSAAVLQALRGGRKS